MSSTSNMEGKDLDFGATEFLLEHVQSILQFYDGKCYDEKNGGFFQFFKVFVNLVTICRNCLNIINEST